MPDETEDGVPLFDAVDGMIRRRGPHPNGAETRDFVEKNYRPAEFQANAANRIESAPIIATMIVTGRPLPVYGNEAAFCVSVALHLLQKVREAGSGGYLPRYERAFAWAADPKTTIEAAALFLRMFNRFQMSEDELRAFGSLIRTDAYKALQARVGFLVPTETAHVLG